MLGRRKTFIVPLLWAMSRPLRTFASPMPNALARVGFLSSESGAGASERARLREFKKGLESLGWVEGKNVLVEYRSAEGRYDRLRALASDLVRHDPDVIVASGIKATLAARAVTADIPIVLPGTSSDVVGLGLAASLRHPGGNVTGSAIFGSQIMAKRLQILQEALPAVARIGILWNSANAGFSAVRDSIIAAARKLNVEAEFFEVRRPGELEQVIRLIAGAGFDAVATVPDTLFTQNAKRIAEVLIHNALPSVGTNWFGALGGLLGYGADENSMYRRAAIYVDKILNGTKPGDLPFEQPMTFELVVNLRTARSLGLTMPPAIMVQATRVIR
jgi:putative ABC transport system substrate-binding protein